MQCPTCPLHMSCASAGTPVKFVVTAVNRLVLFAGSSLSMCKVARAGSANCCLSCARTCTDLCARLPTPYATPSHLVSAVATSFSTTSPCPAHSWDRWCAQLPQQPLHQTAAMLARLPTQSMQPTLSLVSCCSLPLEALQLLRLLQRQLVLWARMWWQHLSRQCSRCRLSHSLTWTFWLPHATSPLQQVCG